jgi:epoxyqueuosine reductase QueG
MNAPAPSENLERLRAASKQLGVDILSSARIGEKRKQSFHPSIREIVTPLDYVLVLGIRLSPSVLETVKDAPTWTYYHHYRTVNTALDQAALSIALECQRNGFAAMPIPASQILDWDRLRGHLCHRELGQLAGIGWWGRNNLLVNARYGSHVRYVTVLTDLPLPERGMSGAPENCGDCHRCIEVCPVNAIQESPAYFKLDACTAQLRRFSRSEKLNVMICGLCVRACGGKV